MRSSGRFFFEHWFTRFRGHFIHGYKSNWLDNALPFDGLYYRRDSNFLISSFWDEDRSFFEKDPRVRLGYL
jgi:hypothetical protein